MRLTPYEQDKIHGKAIIAVLLVALLSIAGAIWFGLKSRETQSARLSERSQSIAAALDVTQVAKLKGERSDDGTTPYKNLKTTLASVKAVNPDVRTIYLMGERQGNLFFYVDSEDADSDIYSPAGEIYNDGTPEDHAIFKTGKAIVEGPGRDNFGTFISGLAPVFKPGTKDVIAVVGIDIDANTYWRDIILAASIPLLAGIVLM